MKINTILFDLDGTLVDSNELILETFRQTFNQFQPMNHYSHSDLLEMMGPPLYETFQVVSSDEAIIQEMIQFYRETYKRIEFDYIQIYPDTIEMLKHFKDKNFNLGIVTTKFQESAVPSMKHYHIDEYITVIIGLDDVDNYKPHPEPIYKALSKFSTIENAVMVGDNATDLLAGKNAGILTCGVDWSLKRGPLLETKPDFWIRDFKELIKIIEDYNKEE